MSKKCTPLWQARFQVKMHKASDVRATLGSWDVEKVHAVVASTCPSQNVQSTPFSDHFRKLVHAVRARSTFPSQKCQEMTGSEHFWKFCCRKKVYAAVARNTSPSQNAEGTPFTDHFWKLRCRKSARRCGKHMSKSKCKKHTILRPLSEVEMSKSGRHCGAKHISKSKVSKTDGFGTLLEILLSKKCTPLWPETHLQVKMQKAHHSQTTFGSWDVEKVHAVVASTFPSQNAQSIKCTDHFWKLRCRKSLCRCGAKYISKSKCTKHHMYGPLLTVETWFSVAGARDCEPCQKWAKCEGFVEVSTTIANTLHYTTSHYTTRHSTPLHSTPLHHTTPHHTTLHHTKLQYTTLHYTTAPLHYTPPHYITLRYTAPHCTTLHPTTLLSTTLHSTTLHYTTLNCTTLHYTYHYNILQPLQHTTTTTTTTLHYTNTTPTTTLHYTRPITPLQFLLHMHYVTYTTPQLQLHYITTTAALHHTQSSSCGWGHHCNHCNHSNKHKSNHLLVNQWIPSAIRDSQQPTSPIGFLFWNFRHRLAPYYWHLVISFFPNKWQKSTEARPLVGCSTSWPVFIEIVTKMGPNLLTNT